MNDVETIGDHLRQKHQRECQTIGFVLLVFRAGNSFEGKKPRCFLCELQMARNAFPGGNFALALEQRDVNIVLH